MGVQNPNLYKNRRQQPGGRREEPYLLPRIAQNKLVGIVGITAGDYKYVVTKKIGQEKKKNVAESWWIRHQPKTLLLPAEPIYNVLITTWNVRSSPYKWSAYLLSTIY